MEKKCLYCQKAFEGRPNQRFCSDLCKVRHFREQQVNHPRPAVPEAARPPQYTASSPSELELGIQYEKEKLNLDHKERIKKLEMQQEEQLRQHQMQESARAHRRELEIMDKKRAQEREKLREDLESSEAARQSLEAQLEEERKTKSRRSSARQQEEEAEQPESNAQQETENDGSSGFLWLLVLGAGYIYLRSRSNGAPPTVPDPLKPQGDKPKKPGTI